MNEAQARLKPRELETLQKQAEKYPQCSRCQIALLEGEYFSPRHEASPGCMSGKRPHCTCDFCW